MKIVISPAKKMAIQDDFDVSIPKYIDSAKYIHSILKNKNDVELKKIWNCSDKVLLKSKDYLSYSLDNTLSPAINCYQGIQYQYMAPHIFTYDQIEYLNSHLYILSAYYGLLKPLDGIRPYRLEMGSTLKIDNKSLYDFWSPIINKELENETIINLASKEYSKVIHHPMITCLFGEIVNNKFKQKATYAKILRGEMVRYMVENHIEDYHLLKDFTYQDYSFNQDLSTEDTYYYTKTG